MIYTANTKRNPKHRDSVQDSDLFKLLVEKQSELPWLPDLLEELQALRNTYRAFENNMAKEKRLRDLKETMELTEFHYQIPWTMFNNEESLDLCLRILKKKIDDMKKGLDVDEYELFVRKMRRDLTSIENSH